MMFATLGKKLAGAVAFRGWCHTPPPAWGMMAMLVVAAGLCWLLARAVLGLPYITDDLSILHEAALLRAHQASWLEHLSKAHNEHRIPILRLLYFWTAADDFNAMPLRLVIVGVHALCACAAARIIFCTWGPWPAAAVGSLAACAVGFSAMPLWAPSTVIFSLSCTFLLAAIQFVHCAGRFRMVPATIAVALAGLTLNASMLCVPLLLVVLWKQTGRSFLWRCTAGTIWLAIAAAILWWTVHGASPAGQALQPGLLPEALRNALFIIVSAPYRWLMAWGTGTAGKTPGWGIAALAFGMWACAHFAVSRPLRPMVVLLSACAAVIAAAVGYGRAEFSLGEIYGTDRYYYWFLVPLSVSTVALACRFVRASHTGAACAGIMCVSLLGGWRQSQKSLQPVPNYPWIRSAAAGMETAKRLAVILSDTAAKAPIAVNPRSFVPIAGLHMGRISICAICYAMKTHAIAGLDFSAGKTQDSDARMNEVLQRWAQGEGWPSPPVQSRGGKLEPLLLPRIDFSQAASGHQLVSGFYDFDGHSRWMGVSGIADLLRSTESWVHIVISAPHSLLAKKLPQATRFAVDVSAEGKRIGTLQFSNSDYAHGVFPLPAAAGNRVRITLDSAFSWKAKEAYPENEDPRRLTVQVRLIELVSEPDRETGPR